MRLRRGGRLRVDRPREEMSSPMETVANLVDVMLVFACGLIVALIAAWNVDVSENPYQVDNISESERQSEVRQDDLQERGTLYQDPSSGKFYVIEDK